MLTRTQIAIAACRMRKRLLRGAVPWTRSAGPSRASFKERSCNGKIKEEDENNEVEAEDEKDWVIRFRNSRRVRPDTKSTSIDD